jgi:hypothetical protein
VLIDGDHSLKGITQDTALSHEILKPDGTVCWHDANPKPNYQDDRSFLETKCPLRVIATQDSFLGGIASLGPILAS